VAPFQVVLHAISGRTGERHWDRSMDDGGMSSGVSPILLDDADGDGVSEVLVGTCDWWWHGGVMRNGRIRCLSGASGKPLWELGVDEVSIPETEPR
jgi:outer membrane protein assembly factor BamB